MPAAPVRGFALERPHAGLSRCLLANIAPPCHLQVMEEEAREREEVAKMNADELRRFDQELESRTRQRDIDMGRRWKP